MKVYFSRDKYYVPTFNTQEIHHTHCIEVPDNLVKKWERAEQKMEEAWEEMREYMAKAEEEGSYIK